MKKNIQVLHPDGENLFKKDVEIKELVSGLQFAEGPVWHPEGYLLVSDIPANRIFMLSLNKVINVLCHHSGGPYIILTHLSKMIGSNGLYVDGNKNIFVCQHGNHSIAKLDTEKNVTVLCSSYNGKPLNSPNDLVIKSNGALYFTDPPYGLKDEVLNEELFQPHSGVYKFENNHLDLLTAEMKYPNGICFSKDEKSIFISNSDPEEGKIYRYRVNSKGELFNKSVFAEIQADGIKTDRFDKLYAATSEGVVIFSSQGEKIALIQLPELATNVAFGGKESNLLFVTTPSAVFYLELTITQSRVSNIREKMSEVKSNTLARAELYLAHVN
jgi:gluconolactonase